MNLGENIYRLRTSRKLSQDALAEALDVSRQSVSKWENNMAVPDLDKLIKMKELFGITLDELVAEEPPEPGDEPAPQPLYSSSLFQTRRKLLIAWGVYFAVSYFLFRILILFQIGIPLAAAQATISIYTLRDFRGIPYPFTKRGKLLLILCGFLAYFFGLRLFTLEPAGFYPQQLAGDLYDQIYLVMLTFHISVTVLIKALISWLRTRRNSPKISPTPYGAGVSIFIFSQSGASR